MTTVINLNILNFFRLKLNKYTVNDVRVDAHFSDTRENHSTKNEHVIDITPCSKIVADKEAGDNNGREPAIRNFSPAELVFQPDQPAVINKTYDRRGNSVQYFQSKGMHIDSYI